MKTKELSNKRKGLTLFLLTCLVMNFSLHAQVTVGGLTEPAKGAILDLNSTVRGGLVLSNVEIKNLFTIPNEIPAPPETWTTQKKLDFTGALVYHTGGNGIPTGVCFWNGERWIAVACTLPILSPADTDNDRLYPVGESVTFTVNTTGTEPFSCQWYKNGIILTDSTKNTLTFHSLTAGDEGTYFCIVTNACGSAQSGKFVVLNPATLPAGSSTLSGTLCFDAGASSSSGCGDLSVRTATDFTTNVPHTYTFTASGAASNVHFFYTDGENCVSSTSETSSGNLAGGGTATFNITYANDLNTRLTGRTRTNPAEVMLYAVYYDGMKYVSVPKRITIQDCQCCWAYLTINGNPEWRTFMCHNLGADEDVDPFTPDYRINGAYYLWGSQTAIVGNPINSSGASPSYTWNSPPPSSYYGNNVDGDTDATEKSDDDPCPDGYRVPSENEWTGLKDYYTTDGSSDNINLVDSSTGWTDVTNCLTCFSGKNFGGALFLPAAGYRYSLTGSMNDRGCEGGYWSSLRNGTSGMGFMNFGSGYTRINISTSGRANGFSVRCIAE